MSVPLSSEQSQDLAGMQRDKTPVEWPRSEGREPTEGSMLGWLLWKPMPMRGPLHESHSPKPVEIGEEEREKQEDEGLGEMRREGGND